MIAAHLQKLNQLLVISGYDCFPCRYMPLVSHENIVFLSNFTVLYFFDCSITAPALKFSNFVPDMSMSASIATMPPVYDSNWMSSPFNLQSLMTSFVLSRDPPRTMMQGILLPSVYTPFSVNVQFSRVRMPLFRRIMQFLSSGLSLKNSCIACWCPLSSNFSPAPT